MPRSNVVTLLCACLLMTSGCAAYAHATGGFASNLSPSAPAAPSVVVDGAYGGTFGTPILLWPSLGLRVRGGKDLVQIAPSLELRGALPSLITPVYGLGLRVLSLEANDGGFGFGMFGPYAELGVFVALGSNRGQRSLGGGSLGGGTGLVVHVDGGYDVRFTHQPNSLWASVSVGYALYAWAH